MKIFPEWTFFPTPGHPWHKALVTGLLVLAATGAAQAGRDPKPVATAAGAGSGGQTSQVPQGSKPAAGAGAGVSVPAAQRKPVQGMAKLVFQILEEDEGLREAVEDYRGVLVALHASAGSAGAPADFAQAPKAKAALEDLRQEAQIAAASALAAAHELQKEMEATAADLADLEAVVLDQLGSALEAMLAAE